MQGTMQTPNPEEEGSLRIENGELRTLSALNFVLLAKGKGRAGPSLGGLQLSIVSALLHQADVEFHGPGDGFQADLFVVAVDALSLLACHIHGREAVNMVTQIPVVP